MDHNLQVLLAIGISAALCLVTWTWARYCSVLTGKTIDGKDSWSESRSRAEVFCIVSFSIRCRPQ